MSFINTIIGYPLGWVMWFLFRVVGSYGVALLLFTIFSRLVMIPTSIGQQKATAKMTVLRPQQAEIQKKYANNQKKMNEEMMALYKRENFSPSSGCLPMALQFLFLFGIIDVIYKPLTHIVRLSSATVGSLTSIASGLGAITSAARAPELEILRSVFASTGLNNFLGLGDAAARIATSLSIPGIPQLALPRMIFGSMSAYSAIDTGIIQTLNNFVPNMSFLGINLMERPTTSMIFNIFSNFNPVVLIPVLSGITSLLFSLSTMKQTALSTQGQPGANGMKIMMLIMPVFSLTFTFSVPAGVGLYWTYSNVVGFIQNRIMNKMYNPKQMAEAAQKEAEERREQERQERIEAKKRAKELGVSDAAITKKDQNRRNLAEARKRDAEKYGEVYEESQDDDI